MTNDETVVRAAGVVLLRPGRRGPQIAVVHRPHRADWSLPKGKLDPGESPVVAAVRECDEETGIVPTLGPPLPLQQYLALGIPKEVRYWRAGVNSEVGFAPDEEVDEVRWVDLPEAKALLTYPRDVDLINVAIDLPATSPLIVLRHAKAVKRSDYKGDKDAQRPLSGKGRSQANALVPLLSAFDVRHLYASDALRCQQTLQRYAKYIDVRIESESSVSEEGHVERPKQAARRINDLLHDPKPLVICSHRPVLPALLQQVGQYLTEPTDTLDPKLSPGGFVVAHRSFNAHGEPHIISVERHEF